MLDLKPVGADPTLTRAVSKNPRAMIIHGGRFEMVERAQLGEILAEQRLAQIEQREEQTAPWMLFRGLNFA